MRTPAVLAAFVAALAFAPAAYAGEANATTCDGSLTDVVVEGDLVVPSGATCTVGGVHVLGDVIVEANASLFGDFVLIDGGVTIGSGAFFNVQDSGIGGDTVCTGCRHLGMTFMFDPRFDVPVRGDIRVTGMTDGHVGLEVGQIDGDVEVTDSSGSFAFIGNSITGRFRFENNVGNAGFWFNSAEKDFKIVGNVAAGGGFPADFTLQGNYARKNLVFSGNTGASELTENSAEKDLKCFANQPPPVGWGNSAGSDVEGQCAALTGPPPE